MLSRRNESILWLALLVFAAFLRLAPIGANLPYISYIDEGHVLHPAIEILKAESFDSSRFTYPPLSSYLTVLAAEIYRPIYRFVHHHAFRRDLPSDADFHTPLGDNYDLITPPEIIVLGRVVMAGLSIATVALAGLLARRLAGPSAGLFALSFAAVVPALVSRGGITILDTTATCFAITALYFCERMRGNSASAGRYAILAGLAAGLAFGGKYTVGVVFAAVLVTIATLSPVRSKLPLVVAAFAGFVVGVFCGVPAAILHPAKILAELHAQAAFYQTIQAEQNYWTALLAASEVGVPLFVAGLAGVVLMVARPELRPAALAWLVFAILLLLVVGWARFQPFRNLLSIVPLLSVSAAIFLEELRQYFVRRNAALGSALVSATAIVLSLGMAWMSLSYFRTRVSHVDSRIQAIDWLRQHATKQSTILGIRELAISPTEWKRLSAKVTVVSWFDAADFLARERFDFLVTGNFDLRYAPDPAAWSAYGTRWASLTSSLPDQAKFGAISTPVVPYLWRTNDELVFILKP